MAQIFPQIFILGVLLTYLALLAGLVWWAWRSRERPRRRLPRLVNLLRETWNPARRRGSKRFNT